MKRRWWGISLSVAVAGLLLSSERRGPEPALPPPLAVEVRPPPPLEAAAVRAIVQPHVKPKKNLESSQKTYSTEGLKLAVPAGTLSIGLEEIRIGGRPLSLPTRGAPRSDAGETVYVRGAVTEKYVARGEAIEQIFVLDSSLEPLKSGGGLTIDVSLGTKLVAVHVTKGPSSNPEVPTDLLEFKGPDGGTVFTYGGALAIDADGRKQALTYALHGDRLEMELEGAFLANARFPLTIDPLIGTNLSIDVSASNDREPDVAFSSMVQSWLVVYERDMGAANGDIYCSAVSTAGIASTSVAIASDATVDSRNPKVARSNTEQFLVVWEEFISGNWQIKGRFVKIVGAVPTLPAAAFPIYSVAGQDQINPDVGFCSSSSRYLVAWESVINPATSDHDIFVLTVTTSGGLSGILQVDNSAQPEEKPTVSPVSNNPMGVAWVKRTAAGAQGDIYAASIDVGGAAPTTPGRVAVSIDALNEDLPDLGGTAGSPGFIVWSRQISGFGGDIYARKATFSNFAPGVTFGTAFDIESGLAHAFRPHCDLAELASDKRLMITYTENPTFPPSVGSGRITVKIGDYAKDPPDLLETHSPSTQLTDSDNGRLSINPGSMTSLVVWDNFVSSTDTDIYGQLFSLIPVAGFTVTPDSLATTEDGPSTATFTVVLTKAPTASVTINLSSSDLSEGTVSPSSLAFNSANWNIAQTVAVTGVDDFVVDGAFFYTIITAPAVSGDPSYRGLDPIDVSVVNLDNDVAGINVSTGGLALITTESGGTATFTVVLTSLPTEEVIIGLSNSNPAEGTVPGTPPSLTFTPTNGLTPQTVTVTGVNDFVVDGDIAYTIRTDPASSTDPNYNEFDTDDVSVTNKDDDVAGIFVTPISLTTTEAGGTATFTVVLTSQPVDSVTINLTSSDTMEGIVSPVGGLVLTFFQATALTPQTVTVTGINDAVADGDIAYTIRTDPASSTDPNYSARDASDVSVITLSLIHI